MLVTYALFLVIGIAAGFLSGLLGIGGGIVIVPALSFIFVKQGFLPDSVMHYAVGTSIACIVLTTSMAMRTHIRMNNVEKDLLKVLVPGLLLGVCTGVYFSHQVSSQVLSYLFAGCTFVIALNMMRKKSKPGTPHALAKFWIAIITFLIGGAASALGLGGGVFIVPFLNMLGHPINKVVGTSVACSFIMASFGLIGHLSATVQPEEIIPQSTGYVHWPAVLLVMITGVISANIGAKMTKKVPADTIRKLFAVILIITSVKLTFAV